MVETTKLDQQLRAAQQADESIAGLQKRLSALENFSAELTDGSESGFSLSTVEEEVTEIKETLAQTEALGKDASHQRSQVETLEGLISTLRTHAQPLPNQEAGEISTNTEQIEEIPDDVLQYRLSAVVSLLRSEQERPDSSTEQYTQKVDLSRAIREEALNILSTCVDTVPEILCSTNITPLLIAIINEGRDATGRTHAAYTLRILNQRCPDSIETELIPTVTEALKHGPKDTRYHAVYTLQTAATRTDLPESSIKAIQATLEAGEESTRVGALVTLETVVSESPESLTAIAIRRVHRIIRTSERESVQESAFELVGTILREGSGRLSTEAETVLQAELESESPESRCLATLELFRTPAELISDKTTRQLDRRHFEAVVRRSDNPADNPRIHEEGFEEQLSSNEEIVESKLVPVLLEIVEDGDHEQVVRSVKWLLFVIQSRSISMSEEALQGVYLGIVHDHQTARENSLQALADALGDSDDELVDLIVRAKLSETGSETIFESALQALFVEDIGIQFEAARIVARSILAFQTRADEELGDPVAKLFNEGVFDSAGVPKAIAGVVANMDEPQRELLEPVRTALNAERDQRRKSAVEVCKEVQKKTPSGLQDDILEEILELRNDPDSSVRGALAAALPAFSTTSRSDIASVLRSLINDEQQLVQIWAISNLSDIEMDGKPHSNETVFESILRNTGQQDTDAGVVRGLYAEQSFRTLSHRGFRELLVENPELLTESALEELVTQTTEGDIESIAIDTVEVAVSERPDLSNADVVECAVNAVRGSEQSVRMSGFELIETLATHRADLLNEAAVEAVLDRPQEFEDLKTVLDILDSVIQNRPTVLTENRVRELVALTSDLRDRGVLTPAELWRSAELLAEMAQLMPAAIDPRAIDLLISYFDWEHSVVQLRTGRALQTIAEHAPNPVLGRQEVLLENGDPAGQLALAEALVASGTEAASQQQLLREQVASPMCPESAKSVFIDFLARAPSQQARGTGTVSEQRPQSDTSHTAFERHDT